MINSAIDYWLLTFTSIFFVEILTKVDKIIKNVDLFGFEAIIVDLSKMFVLSLYVSHSSQHWILINVYTPRIRMKRIL